MIGHLGKQRRAKASLSTLGFLIYRMVTTAMARIDVSSLWPDTWGSFKLLLDLSPYKVTVSLTVVCGEKRTLWCITSKGRQMRTSPNALPSPWPLKYMAEWRLRLGWESGQSERLKVRRLKTCQKFQRRKLEKRWHIIKICHWIWCLGNKKTLLLYVIRGCCWFEI